MPDTIFAHPRLAAIYDAFDNDRSDLDFYVAVADEFQAQTVVDIGCGTGTLALLLAATGRKVIAVDPAAASLAVANSKPGAANVTWIQGTAPTLPALSADLATMTGNVAQVFLTDDDWSETLRAIRTTLRPGGKLVFETRRPEQRAWEEWAAATAPRTLDIEGTGPVELRSEVTEVALPLVTFRNTYRFKSDGEVLTSTSTLRFRTQPEIESTLTASGFQITDLRDAPDRPTREFMFIAERPT